MTEYEELKFAESDEYRHDHRVFKADTGGAEKPLVVVKSGGTPYSRSIKEGKRKIIEVGLPVRASDNLLKEVLPQTRRHA